MKNSISLLATMALVALSSPLTTNAATQVYDLKTDWSDTQNPNGTWSYRRIDGSLLQGDPLPWGQESGDVGFEGITRTTEASVVSGFLSLGDIFVHTTSGTTLRWTAPANGNINISGTAWSMEPIPVEGDLPIPGAIYEWALSQNQSLLKGGFTAGTRDVPYDLSSGDLGSSTLQDIPVQAGDQINLTFIPFLVSWGDDAGKMGLNFTVILTPDSVDPVTAIENLALTVFEMNLQNGIENSLDSKLDAALNALGDANVNNDGAACNSLAAFSSAVEAQRGNKITSAQADQLIASVQEIQALLNCGQ